MILSLPIPPSDNNLFFNLPGRGRAKSKHYRDWLKQAKQWALMQKPWGAVSGPYRLAISIPKVSGDVPNRGKAVTDFLVGLGVTPDDRHCRGISINVVSELKDHCIVAVEAVG